MTCFTWWQRLEPRARSHSLRPGLASPVRDASWILSRQWQMGEFQGEDAASPAYFEVVSQACRPEGWRATAGADPSPMSFDVQALVAEPFPVSDGLRGELGVVFERQIGELRVEVGGASFDVWEAYGEATRAFLLNAPQSWMHGRVLDGVTVYDHGIEFAETAPVNVPAFAEAHVRQALVSAVEEYRQRVIGLYGELGAAEPPTWSAEELDHSLSIDVGITETTDVKKRSVQVHPGPWGLVDWHSMSTTPGSGSEVDPTAQWWQRQRCLPARAKIPGAPPGRWWRVEPGEQSLVHIRPDKTDVGTTLFVDFIHRHADDWFLLPLILPRGMFHATTEVVVYDIFGGRALSMDASGRSTVFSLSSTDGAQAPRSVFFQPAVGSVNVEIGPSLERAQLSRDEVDNLLWLVEHIVWDNGTARPGVEALPPADSPALRDQQRYVAVGTPPPQWSALGAVPLSASGGRVGAWSAHEVWFELGRDAAPRTQIAAAYRAGGRIRDSAIPTIGLSIDRRVYRARDDQGAPRLWVCRSRAWGGEELRSGLAFDVTHPAGRLGPAALP